MYRCCATGMLKNQGVSLDQVAFRILHYPPKPKITKLFWGRWSYELSGTNDKTLKKHTEVGRAPLPSH
jgi:hypothetical protein